jgi:histone-lysine N-methyltransferase SETMAR
MDFLNDGETINAEKYCLELNVVRQKLAEKQPSLVNRKGVLLLHDNARPHIARMTYQKLLEIKFETLPHPPYSPDLSPTDFHLFKHLDHFLQQKKFSTRAAIEDVVQEFIDSRSP